MKYNQELKATTFGSLNHIAEFFTVGRGTKVVFVYISSQLHSFMQQSKLDLLRRRVATSGSSGTSQAIPGSTVRWFALNSESFGR